MALLQRQYTYKIVEFPHVGETLKYHHQHLNMLQIAMNTAISLVYINMQLN